MEKRERSNVKQAIAAAMMELLREKTVDCISIKELIGRANVSHMAYYRNFSSKREILEYYLECNFYELVESLGEKNVRLWSYEFGIAFFSMMQRHREEILLLDEHGFAGLVLNVFNEYNEMLEGDMAFDSIDRYRLYYAAGASYNAALQWLKHGCVESVQDISRNCAEFLGIK